MSKMLQNVFVLYSYMSISTLSAHSITRILTNLTHSVTGVTECVGDNRMWFYIQRRVDIDNLDAGARKFHEHFYKF